MSFDLWVLFTSLLYLPLFHEIAQGERALKRARTAAPAAAKARDPKRNLEPSKEEHLPRNSAVSRLDYFFAFFFMLMRSPILFAVVDERS